MKVRDVLKRLNDDGWILVRTTGSHRHLKRPSKPGIFTVPGHPSDEFAPGMLRSTYRQAGWEY